MGGRFRTTFSSKREKPKYRTYQLRLVNIMPRARYSTFEMPEILAIHDITLQMPFSTLLAPRLTVFRPLSVNHYTFR
jgi:hypothetical protein